MDAMADGLIEKIHGGVTAPQGFRAGGIAAGIKKTGKPDLALVYSECPSVAAGMFTTNKVCAAPVKWCRNVVGGADVRAIIANSGNANACTGGKGLKDAQEMAALTGDALGLRDTQVLVCSTGRIGRPLPMDALRVGIPKVVAASSRSGGSRAATAIMTSDTKPKEVAVETVIGGKSVRVGGMAKGAGMIDPTMATMLAFITTDAAIERTIWKKTLQEAVAATFNRITVDGDMSTNDTVLGLANGAAGNPKITRQGEDSHILGAAVQAVCSILAQKIVGDGERVTRFVEVVVTGAASQHDAALAANAVAKSQLVKSSWSGGDPNWGRILCAVGYSGADVIEERIDVDYDDVAAVRGGIEVSSNLKAMRRAVARKRFRITINLNIGEASHFVWTTDLTPDYVIFNQSE